MDKALSFANGVRIGEAWLRESARGRRKAQSAPPSENASAAHTPVDLEEAANGVARVELLHTSAPIDPPALDHVSEGSTLAVEGSGPVTQPGVYPAMAASSSGAVMSATAPAPVTRPGVYPAMAGSSSEAVMSAIAPGPAVPAGPAGLVEPPARYEDASRSGFEAVAAPQTTRSSPASVLASPEMATSAAAAATRRSAAVPSLEPMHGITVGVVNEAPSAPPQQEIHRSLASQAGAAALFFLALVPPIATSLLLGLSHRAHLIPFAPVWAWMALFLALGATIRSAMAASRRSTEPGSLAGSTAAWLAPVLLGVLLLVPSALVLYLRLTLTPVPLRLAAAQIALYTVIVVALLPSSRSAVPE